MTIITTDSEGQGQAVYAKEQRILRGKKCRLCSTPLTPENVSRFRETGIPRINPTATFCQTCDDEFSDEHEEQRPFGRRVTRF